MNASLLALLHRDAQADRVVPPRGFTAQLTLFAAGAMTFLAVFALALSLAAGRLAQSWAHDLAGSATLRIVAQNAEREAQTKAALAVLETTPGVTKARAMTDEEQRGLLAPWLGANLEIEALPVPRLIAMDLDFDAFDAAALRLRLSAEVPGAILDDHAQWRAPLLAAARRLIGMGWLAAFLIFAVLAAMVTLAARAALAANAQVIEVLRLIGATDDYIAGAFVRRFTKRAGLGAMTGTVVGLLALWLIPAQDVGPQSLLTDLQFQGTGWIAPLLIPLLSACVAFFATMFAARNVLKEVA